MPSLRIDDLAKPCFRCGEDHDIVRCPHVRAIDIDDEGRICRVEFLTPVDYPAQPKPAPFEPAYPTLGKKNP